MFARIPSGSAVRKYVSMTEGDGGPPISLSFTPSLNPICVAHLLAYRNTSDVDSIFEGGGRIDWYRGMKTGMGERNHNKNSLFPLFLSKIRNIIH